MKLNDLKKAAAKAQQDLHLAARKAADLRQKAQAAKARSEQTRLEHKRARKAAKQAKKSAAAAEEQARDYCRVFEKAQKRLAKAVKKLGQGKTKQKGKPARLPAVARASAPAKPAPKKQAAMVPKPHKTAAGSRPPSAAAGSATSPPVIPTV